MVSMAELSGLALAAGGLTDINLGLTVWTIVLFVAFATLLGKFGWGPLLQLIDEREKSVRGGIEGAHKANTEAAALLDKHKEMIREAGRERDEIMKRSLAEAEQIKADITAKARSEGEALLKRAKEQIDREKALAILDLRAQVADIAVLAASKIVTSSLTPEAQRKLVSETIEKLPKAIQS